MTFVFFLALGCYAMLCNLVGVLLCYAVMKTAPQSHTGRILSILDRVSCKRIADYLEKSASAKVVMTFRTAVFEVPTGQGYLSATTNGGLGLVETTDGVALYGCTAHDVVATNAGTIDLGNDTHWRGRIISCQSNPSWDGRTFYMERVTPS